MSDEHTFPIVPPESENSSLVFVKREEKTTTNFHIRKIDTYGTPARLLTRRCFHLMDYDIHAVRGRWWWEDVDAAVPSK